MSKQEIIEIIKNHKNNELLKNMRIGLAGSYARNESTQDSDIDLILDGDSTKIDAAIYLEHLFPIQVDVLWINLLKEEDLELDQILLDAGLQANKYSVYKSVLQDVIWI